MLNLSICLISFFVLMIYSLLSFVTGIYFLWKEIIIFFDFNIISFQSAIIEITILLDWISLFFISFVTFISSLVILYSKEYIIHDKYIVRFILLVLIFVLSIIFLIIRPNIIRILLGWDGLGLVSYCLVIYFQNVKSYNAGIITALSNRIGDVLILLTIAWLLNYGSWNFIFYLDLIVYDNRMKWVSYLVVIAAITKRAQIPFSAWLPAAIAAPTPVSALVHSSTLVTAGVYLLIRFNNLIRLLPICQWLLIISSLTMFIAGLGANFEFDLKKIIALSTLRQLGLIIRILSIGFPILAFFHLLTHALFKALLFICAGVVIHCIKNFQDIRYIGALINQLPITISYFNVANFALCGFPFLAGFYSKDLILEIVSFSEVNLIIYFLYYLSTGLTVCYSVRLIFYSIYSNFIRWTIHNLYDSSKVITLGMTGLLTISVIIGAGLSWLIFPVPQVLILPIYFKLLTLIVCLLGGLLGWGVFKWSLYIKRKISIKKIGWYVGLIWFLPGIRIIGLIFPFLKLRNLYQKSLDYGWLEEIGGQNLNLKLRFISQIMQDLQNNNFKRFLMIFFLWSFIFVLVLLWIYLNSLYKSVTLKMSRK